MKMYFASDTDKILKNVFKLLQDGKSQDAAKALASIRYGAIDVPEKQIVASFTDYPISSDDMVKVVRRNLKAARKARGYRVEDVVDLTGLSRSAIYGAENGSRNYAMNILTLFRLCECYVIDVKDVFSPYFAADTFGV